MAGRAVSTPIVVRRATAADADPACEVVCSSIRDCCSDDHQGDAKTIGAWLRNKTPAFFQSIIAAPHGHAVVAEVDGVVVGFAACSASGELTLCYATPAVRFTGVGKAMLGAIESFAMQSGQAVLHLDSTRSALAFYLRNGFEADGPAVTVFGLQGQPMRKALLLSA